VAGEKGGVAGEQGSVAGEQGSVGERKEAGQPGGRVERICMEDGIERIAMRIPWLRGTHQASSVQRALLPGRVSLGSTV